MVTIHLSPTDIVETRFAFSRMWEVMMSYRVLLNPSQHTLYLRWVREAKQALSGVDVRYLDVLVGASFTDYMPDFLTPPLESPQATFEEELIQVRETPPKIIRRDVRTMLNWRNSECDVLQHYLEAPGEALGHLVKTIQAYWERTLAHHWHRIQATLEGDVLYRSRQLALEGPEAFFNQLHHLVSYEDEELRVIKHFDAEVAPGGDGLTLVPVLFSWPKLYLILEGPRRPVIGYSPRGAGLWNSETIPPSKALARAMGKARASVLTALTTPKSTGEIARKLDRTAGAVSQHLGRLKEAGLAEPLRQGRYVYYRLTERGNRMIDLFLSH